MENNKYKHYVDSIYNEANLNGFKIEKVEIDDGQTKFFKVAIVDSTEEKIDIIHGLFNKLEKEARRKEKQDFVFYVSTLPK